MTFIKILGYAILVRSLTLKKARMEQSILEKMDGSATTEEEHGRPK